jgi:hypothetical protein
LTRASFSRRGPDQVIVGLGAGERRVIGAMVTELRTQLDDPGTASPGGTLARLFPPAFPDDPEAEASYADLVREDLVDGRRERLDLVLASLDEPELDDARALAWMTVLNDLRLTLGTLLDVSEDDALGRPDDDDPDAFRWAVYGWLGWLVGELVEALEDTLPDVADGPA